jgi:hypothetical protein
MAQDDVQDSSVGCNRIDTDRVVSVTLTAENFGIVKSKEGTSANEC